MPSAPLRLSDLLAEMARRLDDPDVLSVFLTYERPNGEIQALIHCPQGLRHMTEETILLATEACHTPALGMH